MNERYLSLSDAESYTGKSRSSLRRFVEAITKPENHPDRRFVQPSIEEVKVLHAANHPFSWKISQELLDRRYSKQGTDPSSAATLRNDAATELLSVLQKTIAMLENQIGEKDKQIALFQERQRETNNLLQQTTEKLVLLSDGTKRRPTSNDDSITIHSASANDFRSEEGSVEEGSESSETSENLPTERKTTASPAKKRNTTPKKPARKTLWQRLQTKLF